MVFSFRMATDSAAAVPGYGERDRHGEDRGCPDERSNDVVGRWMAELDLCPSSKGESPDGVDRGGEGLVLRKQRSPLRPESANDDPQRSPNHDGTPSEDDATRGHV
jgi:hypothetical protein